MKLINILKKRLLPTTILTVFGAIGICVNSSEAAKITIDPDNFSVFQDISTAIPGVQLSLINDNPSSPAAPASIVVVQGSAASTGSRVFGRGIPGFFPDESFFEPGIFTGVLSVFKASFDTPTDFVSIDVIKVALGDFGRLRAFDSSNNLVAESITPSLGSFGNFSTVSISRPIADISYILAAGYPPPQSPPFNGVALDNFKFNQVSPEQVPEPLTILGSITALCFGLTLKRGVFKKQKKEKVVV
ncbi:MAG: PEP-CTERM sorting domain-containing protein [Nostocaceae cyanobacterium]|nr:PEP-CTERM sorting domain-containing protein [Nostocaceae cyanobacterium]